MFTKKKDLIINTFDKGLWQDSIASLQPQGTYREAWGAMNESDLENSFGLTNEPANELHVAINGEVRGLVFVEERDKYVAFVVTEQGEGQLGLIDIKNKSYNVLTTSKDLEISYEEWVDCEVKVMQPCNQLFIYFSTKDTYKYINLDDPCCKFEVKELIKAECLPVFDFDKHKKGGNVPNGTYWFFARLIDTDGNSTNYSKIRGAVHVSDQDHKQGERSNQAIHIKIKNLPPEFNQIELGVISITSGITTYEHFDTVSYGGGYVDYLYRGKTGKEVSLSPEIIRGRNSRYIRGKNLMQYDGRIVLYNVRSEHNLDYQRIANEIETFYDVWVVPSQYAEDYKGLRPNENYQYSIQWNYNDNTSSANYPIFGRKATASDEAIIEDPCNPACKLPRWRLQDTSSRTEKFVQLDAHENADYNDDISMVDNNREGNYQDKDLSDDEKDTVEDTGDLAPTNPFEDVLTQTQEGMKQALDCICEKLPYLRLVNCSKWDPKCGPIPNCDPCDSLFVGGVDLSGTITLEMLECMCTQRTVTDSPRRPRAPRPGIPRDPDTPGGNLVAELNNDEPPIQGIDNIPDNIPDSDGTCAGGNCSGGCSGGSCGSGSCGSGGCTSCGGSGCGGGAKRCGSKDCASCGTSVEFSDATYSVTSEGRSIEVAIDYALKRMLALDNELQNTLDSFITCSTCNSSTCSNAGCGDSCTSGCQLIDSGVSCCVEGLERCVDGICLVCKDGFWRHENNVKYYDYRPQYLRTKKVLEEGEAFDPTFDFKFENIYDEDGCTIIGVKPKKYATGKFGYWETKEIVPFTEDCNCTYIYGEEAGKPLRLHKVPSISKEPMFISFSGGVPNEFDTGNIEDKNSYVFFITPRFTNIKPPTNLPKPLCPNNPFSINYCERTEANKSVIGSGLAISCFKGEIQGEAFAFPKHGVNSWERFDRSIEPRGPSTFRGGTAMATRTSYDPDPANVSPYIIHSADFHMRQPPLDAEHCLFELELFGKGFRHGLGAKGEKAERITQEVQNQKGTRQSLLLNHYRRVDGAGDNYLRKCVNSMEEAPADRVIFAGQEFKYPLCNAWRESSVYTEIDGSVVPFVEGDKQGMGSLYGGEDNNGDNASDRSFTGDVLWHQMPIHDVRGHLVSFVRYLPNQYGSLIGQTYIPLGMEGTAKDLASGNIEGVYGDSYVGYLSFRRTSYISDKTNRKIAINAFTTGLIGFDASIGRFFGKLLSFIFKHLGIRNGGHIPDSGDASNYINMFGGLRRQAVSIGINNVLHDGERVDGELPPPFTPNNTTIPSATSDRNAGDNYFYNLLKSNVWLWMNSDINPAHRELGDPEAMEIYWPKLKGKRLDSAYPDGFNWTRTYLNRFYTRWVENASIKLIFVALFLLVFVYGIGMWIVVEGIKSAIVGLQAIGGGDYMMLQTIGGIYAVLFGGFLMFVGIWWIIYWIKSEADNRLAESLVKLKNLSPDLKNNPEPTRGNYATYSFDNRRIEQFEDNFWAYNPDNNQYNVHEFSYGMSDPYNTCICPEERSVRVPYSNKQNIESHIDAWRNFKLNNYVDIPPDTGKISKIFKLGNRIYVHTTDMLLDLQTGNRTVSLDTGKLLLGSGDLFGAALPIFGGVVEGYAGLKDPNASYVTNWGYIFPDRESKQVFMFNGQSPTPISDLGVRGFLQNNMQFDLLEKFPDFKWVDNKSKYGIGYSVGVDHEHNRLLFTKIDYKPKDGVVLKDNIFSYKDKPVLLGDPDYFYDSSFTRTFYPVKKEWVGRQFYTPRLYAWDRFNMFSFTDEGLWKHNVQGKFNTIYGKRYPFVVDVIVREPSMGYTFDYNGTVVDMEAYVWNGTEYIRNSKIMFDSVTTFNSHQNTGVLDINTIDSDSILNRSKDDISSLKVSYEHRMWVFNGLNDRLINPDEPMFDLGYGNDIPIINSSNIADNRTSNLLSDNHLVYRFSFESRDDVKIFLKKVITKVDSNTISI